MAEDPTDSNAATPPARILVVEDEPLVRDLLLRWLQMESYRCEAAPSAESAWDLLLTSPYDLLVSDVNLPGGSGIDLLGRAKEEFGDSLSVLVMTGSADLEVGRQCVHQGAYAYLSKPLERNQMVHTVAAALQHRDVALQSRAVHGNLEREVLRRTAAISGREQQIVEGLMAAVLRRPASEGEPPRAAHTARQLASALGWDEAPLPDLALSVALRDLGHAHADLGLLDKPGALTAGERAQMQQHSAAGARMLAEADLPALQLAASVARHHHERWDGGGYPDGLAAASIPSAARIAAIADVWEALLSDRPHRPRFTRRQALDIMRGERGAQFDPAMLDVFLELQARSR